MSLLSDLLATLFPRRDALIDRYAEALVVTQGRSDGDDRTVVAIDRLLPGLDVPSSDPDEVPDAARWRLLASSGTRPLRLPKVARPDVMAEYHRAEAEKGRRLIVRDLDGGQVAALLAWHFEAKGASRPHLVVSAAVRDEAAGELRSMYTVLLWHLLIVVAAIDARTVRRRRVGVALDKAILLTPDELQAFGLRRGPTRRNGGHRDQHYYELVV